MFMGIYYVYGYICSNHLETLMKRIHINGQGSSALGRGRKWN